MPFQIGANYPALNVYNNLGVHQAKAADSLARISSGLKAAGGGDVASAGSRHHFECQYGGYPKQHQSGSSCDQPTTGLLMLPTVK